MLAVPEMRLLTKGEGTREVRVLRQLQSDR